MKKIIIAVACVATTIIGSTAYADVNFTTIALAAQYCPALNAMKYIQLFPGDNGKGQIFGINGSVYFLNQDKAGTTDGHFVMQPKVQDSTHGVQNAQWRNVGGSYGRLTNVEDYATINCLYSYTGWTGISV